MKKQNTNTKKEITADIVARNNLLATCNNVATSCNVALVESAILFLYSKTKEQVVDFLKSELGNKWSQVRGVMSRNITAGVALGELYKKSGRIYSAPSHEELFKNLQLFMSEEKLSLRKLYAMKKTTRAEQQPVEQQPVEQQPVEQQPVESVITTDSERFNEDLLQVLEKWEKKLSHEELACVLGGYASHYEKKATKKARKKVA